MKPTAIYYHIPGGDAERIEIPTTLAPYVSQHDIDQIAAGKRRAHKQEPTPLAVKKAAIKLAKSRQGATR